MTKSLIADSRVCDYPAAHSMDTTWFAVDADGYVGSFDSGENGVLPWRAARVEQVFESAKVAPAKEVILYPDDLDSHGAYDCAEFLYRQLLWATPEQVLLNASESDLDRHHSQHKTIEDIRGFYQELAQMDRELYAQQDEEYRKNYPPPEVISHYEEHLMFLSNLELVQPYLESGLARAKPLSDLAPYLAGEKPGWLVRWLSDPAWRSAVAVYFQKIDFTDCLKLHDSGCLYCGNCKEFYSESEIPENRICAYQFAAPEFPSTSPYGKGAYGKAECELPPRAGHPLHVDRLPGWLRVLVEAVRFDTLGFHQTETFDVTEFQPCYDSYYNPFCLAYQPGSKILCCPSIRSETNEQSALIWKRAEEEAARWGYVFHDRDSIASIDARRRVLRHIQHEIDISRREMGAEYTDPREELVRAIENDIAESEKMRGN